MKKLLFLSILGVLVLAGCSNDLKGYDSKDTGATVYTDVMNAMTEDGRHFSVCGFDTLASGASTTFAVKMPTAEGKKPYLSFEIEASGILEVEIYEGGATTTAGTIATPINLNRNSSRTASMWVTKGAYMNGSETLIEEQKYGASSQFTRFGGNAEKDKLILDPGDVYYFKFISGAADNIVTYCGNWYEIADLD